MIYLNNPKFGWRSCRSGHPLITWVIVLTFQLFVGTGAMAQNGPGFDCRYASKATEYLICEEPELSRYDRELNESYSDLLNRVFGAEARRIRKTQKNWLASRDACGDYFDCVLSAYISRIDALNARIDQIDGVDDSGGGSGNGSVWDHNGSTMLWRARGRERIISYLEPRPGISRAGVGSGTVLFEGRRDGNLFYGTAYSYRRGCPPAAYDVEGRIRSETNVVLRGASPVRVKNGCRVVGYDPNGKNATLRFRYLYRQ